jgi:hypothetical protein
VGWNKFWQGSTLFGWYGEIVTRQSIRAVALDVESHGKGNAVCDYIQTLPHPRTVRLYAPDAEDSDDVDQAESLTDVLREVSPMLGVSLSAVPTDKNHKPDNSHTVVDKADGSPNRSEAVGILSSFGFDSKQMVRDKSRLRLLQRLNLDQRDKPFIEQWRWTASAGTAILSDGGRFELKPETIWANAVESSLGTGHNMDPQVLEILAGFSSDEREHIVPESSQRGEALDFTMDYLGKCEFARVMYDRIRLRNRAGKIPQQLAKLYTIGKN